MKLSVCSTFRQASSHEDETRPVGGLVKARPAEEGTLRAGAISRNRAAPRNATQPLGGQTLKQGFIRLVPPTTKFCVSGRLIS